MRWYAFRIHHYAEDKERLILDGVRPAFRRVADHVEAAYFLRHWVRGPHVRLHVRCDERVLESVVRPAVDDLVGGFLAERPSTARLDPEEHLPAHRRLAELESETEELLPWHPDNSIRFDGPLGGDALGSPREKASALRADFYTATNEPAFAMTEDIASGRRRLAIAFDLLIATAHTLSDVGLARGAISFRSHADAFLHGFPEGRGLRPAWEAHHRRNAAAVAARVRAVEHELGHGTGGIPFVRAWVDTLLPIRERARRQGPEVLAADEAPPDGMPVGDITDLTQVSPFHRELFGSDAWNEGVKNSGWFLSYKLMLNYTYLQLTRLGVKPAERFLLCDLAARAVEDVHGISATELLRTAADLWSEASPGEAEAAL